MPVWQHYRPGVARQLFFEAQNKNRRSGRRLIALCMLTVLVLGALSSIILTPLALVMFRLLLGALGWVLPISAERSDPFFQGCFDRMDQFFNYLGGDPVAFMDFLTGGAMLLLPGILFLFGLWVIVRHLFFRAGVGGILHSLQAREPKPEDLEEQQMVNVSQEMAVAAGLAAPRVRIFEGEMGNAAMIGSCAEDATLLVTRGLLDRLDRDDTQGALAYLMASAGNGDLKVAMTMLSVFQTFGLLLTCLDIIVSPTARRTVYRMLKLALKKSDPQTQAQEIQAVSDMLSFRIQAEGMEDLVRFMGEEKKGFVQFLKMVRTFLLLPFILGNLFLKLLVSLTFLFFLGPILALTWRSRVYLADSTAVQLTRDPEGLASALVHLSQIGGLPIGTKLYDLLFIVGAGAGQAPSEKGSFADRHMVVMGFHPSIHRRLKRLKVMGAAKF